MTLRYTPEAIQDLQETKRYISKVLGNPKAAARITRNIMDTCSHLKQHPQMGASIEVKTGQPSDVHYLVCESHIAFYRIDGNIVSIARILDGRQDYLHILFGTDE